MADTEDGGDATGGMSDNSVDVAGMDMEVGLDER